MTNKFYQKKQTSEKKHAKDIKISKTQRKTLKRRQTTNSAKLNSIFEWFRYKARVKTTKTKKKLTMIKPKKGIPKMKPKTRYNR